MDKLAIKFSTHLFVKVPQSWDSELNFSVFESRRVKINWQNFVPDELQLKFAYYRIRPLENQFRGGDVAPSGFSYMLQI